MDYISREDAIDILTKMHSDYITLEEEKTLEEVGNRLLEVPNADVEEVVRCIDCKYSVRPVLATQMKCNRDGVYRWVFFDGYCDMGERK